MSDINVTPFVDVMLVLLIIFMVTAPLLTAGIKINLPESSSILKNEKKDPVTVSINAKGEIFIQKKKFSTNHLIKKLTDLKLRLAYAKTYIESLKQNFIFLGYTILQRNLFKYNNQVGCVLPDFVNFNLID